MKLRTKTVIGVAVIEAVAAVVLLYMMLTFISDTNYQASEKRVRATADLFASSVRDAVLSFDLATLKSVTSEVYSQEDIVYARIIDASGIVMAEAGNYSEGIRENTSSDQPDNVLEARASIMLGNELRARVQIGMDTSYIPALLNDARNRGLLVAAIEMLLVALFSLLLGLLLTRKLKQLEKSAARIGEGDLNTPISVNGNDEVDNVAKALDSMRSRVDVAKTELLDAKSMVEAKNSELVKLQNKRNQLFGMVAHELRTPVAAISMMTYHESKDEWWADRETIAHTASDLLHTIDDMRLLINPELSRPVRSETFTVFGLNTSVASNVAAIVAASGVKYEQLNAIPLELADTEFTSDTYRVRHAICNLVKNACLHSEGSRVWLISRLYSARNGKDYLEWLIGDDGVGIPDQQIQRLFEPGERGDSAAEGTGLGLHITRSWIEEIGGDVEYRRRKLRGSEFLIRIPIMHFSSEGARVPTQAEVDKRQQLDQMMLKLDVLLVEDEAMLRMLGQKLIGKFVNSVEVAENGAQGLLSFNASKHNLVVTDYFMPEMTGVEFTRQLRERGYNGVIVGVTAATIGNQSEELISAGADCVLAKPLTADIWRNTLAGFMENGRFDKSLFEGRDED